MSLSFHPAGQMLASSSTDGTIKLWHIKTGECLKTLRPDRPYERMNITGITGVTQAQIATLKMLGAIETGSSLNKPLTISPTQSAVSKLLHLRGSSIIDRGKNSTS